MSRGGTQLSTPLATDVGSGNKRAPEDVDDSDDVGSSKRIHQDPGNDVSIQNSRFIYFSLTVFLIGRRIIIVYDR